MKNQKRVVLGLLAGLLALGAVGCGSGGGSYDPYYHAWYDVYGRYCYTGRPLPGCNFYSDGSKIVDTEDPYYANYHLDYGTWEYVDSWGYTRYFTGYGWLSNNGILYDDTGYALNEDEENTGRDWMSQAAEVEKAKISEAAQGLVEKFALNEESSLQVAKTLNNWANLGKQHGRTEKDVAEFSQRLFGVSVEKARPALIKAQTGDISALKELNIEVASHWNTDAEVSQAILMSWYKKDIDAAQKK